MRQYRAKKRKDDRTARATMFTGADIERATWDGIAQAVSILDAALEEHGGSCSLYDDHIALRLNGQTLRAKLEQ
jgi:hypothetical protein